MPCFLLLLIMDVIKHFNFNNTVILNGQKKILYIFLVLLIMYFYT